MRADNYGEGGIVAMLALLDIALTYYLRRETVIPSERAGSMVRWRKSLSAAMRLNASRSASYCGLPLAQVVEVRLKVAA